MTYMYNYAYNGDVYLNVISKTTISVPEFPTVFMPAAAMKAFDILSKEEIPLAV